MSDPLSDGAITAALGRHLTQAVQRQAAAAGNLANLDTPGYRTKEVRFLDALDDHLAAAGVATTDARHLGAQASPSGVRSEVAETAGLAARRDGNNVQIDRELLDLTRATGEFTRAQTVLAAKFRLVRYAINEGR
ncbi:MAG: flagellar basal-body rod protein FlgB [Acidobacteria bacterium SCN 69-37]|nr:MAG: flagellar basal-body rod protein FlgB [Acidobacteria bacterium SCN 69-37]